MTAPRLPGPHELGQNFLHDPRTIGAVVDLVATTRGPIVEWAAGDGALTLPMSRLRRRLEAVEIDPRNVARLRRRAPDHVLVTCADMLAHAPPADVTTLVSNVPFHLTTAVLRRVLDLPSWRAAVLITQWEVARRRAGVGGASMLTAQWWPWFEFVLVRRIPASAFTPRPGVDAGLILVQRRPRPLVDGQRAPYQRWVRAMFTGQGRGLPAVLTRSGGLPPRTARRWCLSHGLSEASLPRDLSAEQWAQAFGLLPLSRRAESGHPARPGPTPPGS